jgi:hypothetical protein
VKVSSLVATAATLARKELVFGNFSAYWLDFSDLVASESADLVTSPKWPFALFAENRPPLFDVVYFGFG